MLSTLKALMFAGLIMGSVAASPCAAEGRGNRSELNAKVFDAAWRQVDRHYYDPNFNSVDWAAVRLRHRPAAVAAPDEDALYNELASMLAALHDLHTAAVSPTAKANSQQGRGVLGLRMARVDGRYRIAAVFSGSAAEEAGVPVGWTVESVNDQPYVPGKLRYEVGVPVKLSVKADAQGVQEFRLLPKAATERRAASEQRRPEGAQVIKLPDFSSGRADELSRLLSRTPPNTPLVLDLRGNPGGERTEGFRVLACMVPRHTPIVRIRERGAKPILRTVSHDCRSRRTGPVAVLVDESSSSMAEVVAAALRESGRGKVVGVRTAGAVLGAKSFDLPDGGLLQISVLDMTTPGGERLEKVGVTPDVVSKTTVQDRALGRDPALDAAVAAVTS